MAKIIKMTPECIEELSKEFVTTLQGLKLSDGKVNYSKSFGSIDRKATVFFTRIAWDKMQALVRDFSKEIAWHGLAYRGDDPEKDTYYITDILVYPQEVTASTVTTDQEKYQMWLMQQEDDIFNNIRMQGHSHVNFATSPSGVDNALYDRILDQLDDSMFYVFLIYNKKGDRMYKIYDLAKNVLFETADVTVTVMDEPEAMVHFEIDGLTEEENTALSEYLRDFRKEKRLAEFVASAKEMVKDKPAAYTAPAGSSYFGGSSGYNYDHYWGGGCYSPGTSYTPAAAKNTAGSEPAAAADKSSSGDRKGGDIKYLPSAASKKREKRKGKRRAKANLGGIITPYNSSDDAWDDEDDLGSLLGDGPYSPFGYSRDGFAQ